MGLLSDDPLEPAHLAYLHGRAQNKAHNCVLQVFMDESEARHINKAYIARRLTKRPEVISRWLTAPGNWTLDTLAELLGAMGYEVEFRARSLRNPQFPNRVHDMALDKWRAPAPRATIDDTGSSGSQILNGSQPAIKAA
jgi:hypothetical protein